MKVRFLVSAASAAFGLGVLSLAAAVTSACGSSDANGSTTLHADASAQSTQAEVDDSNLIPCAPRAVLQNVCQQCHGRPTKNGAPFPIQRMNDILSTHSGEVVRQDMIDELNANLMPLAPVTITVEDKATLLNWLNAGAPAVVPTSCVDAGLDASTDALEAGAGAEH